MGKLKIQGKEVRTDILDDAQKASVVDFVNRKPPSSFPVGIALAFDNSGGLAIIFDDKIWYVGAKMNSEIPKQAQACDSIEEALYKCVNAWNDLKNQEVQMPQVLVERHMIRKMQNRGYLPISPHRSISKQQKFYNPDSLDDVSVKPKDKDSPIKPRHS